MTNPLENLIPESKPLPSDILKGEWAVVTSIVGQTVNVTMDNSVDVIGPLESFYNPSNLTVGRRVFIIKQGTRMYVLGPTTHS